MKTTFALLALSLVSTAALADSTGAHNSRVAVAEALRQQYGLEGAELSAAPVALSGADTAWAVGGSAAGRRVRARTVCQRVLFVYNKYDRAYRNDCRVTGLSVR